jgi:hypothetical protein
MKLTTQLENGTDNCSYTRSLGDVHLQNSPGQDKLNIKIPPRATSASATPFSNVYEIPINSTGLSPSTDSPGYNHQPKRRSTGVEPFSRQLSLLDPMSDRVSTILVWKNITVQIREDKRKEAFQRMKSYKNFVPKRKCLLHNVSGAITGGLWAVMGKFSSSI